MPEGAARERHQAGMNDVPEAVAAVWKIGSSRLIAVPESPRSRRRGFAEARAHDAAVTAREFLLQTDARSVRGLLRSRSGLTLDGPSRRSRHRCGDSSGEGIVPGGLPTNIAAVGRLEDCSLRSLYRFAHSWSPSRWAAQTDFSTDGSL